MPPRLVSVGLLIFWALAAGTLFTRDLLPELVIGSPPDLRAISQADLEPGPTRWIILVEDDHAGGALRSIGEVVTDTRRQRDGWVRMTSQAAFDSGQLLRGTPLDTQQPSERVFVTGACEIDPSGNLGSFRAGVRLGEFVRQDVLVVEGHLRKNRIEVTARGLGVPWRQSFPYEPRSMVQNSLQPLDRMPGLQVGQRWESRVVSPLTGRIETARVEVAGRGHITWDDKPTPVLIVITRVPPFTARTWVRNDGVVLRQEVPFPLAKIVLERAAETPELATQRQDHR